VFRVDLRCSLVYAAKTWLGIPGLGKIIAQMVKNITSDYIRLHSITFRLHSDYILITFESFRRPILFFVLELVSSDIIARGNFSTIPQHHATTF
jgi:hypothetical protein